MTCFMGSTIRFDTKRIASLFSHGERTRRTGTSGSRVSGGGTCRPMGSCRRGTQAASSAARRSSRAAPAAP